MSRPLQYVLDDDGAPVPCDDLRAWGQWMATAHRTVAQDRDEGEGPAGWRVSTVFLGLDHRHVGTGPPILWETMVFGGPLDQAQRRYTSRADALRGHRELCARCNAARGPQ